MSEFSFSKGSYQPNTSTNNNNNNNIETTHSDPDPMEMVVQSVIGESLDSSYHALQTLHESQVVLIARIKILEEKMKKYREILKSSSIIKNVNEPGKLQECEQLVSLIREKLTGINLKMETIERRLEEK